MAISLAGRPARELAPSVDDDHDRRVPSRLYFLDHFHDLGWPAIYATGLKPGGDQRACRTAGLDDRRIAPGTYGLMRNGQNRFQIDDR